ncbi:DUF2442 domain-containing protein [Paraburkholderia eburnea]|nr:DUF2442 domain-containing protein [Paraburkholderia eburnea]
MEHDDLAAVSVTANADDFMLALADERRFRIPWKWYPRLLAATPEERNAVQVCEAGARLHWGQAGQDINVVELMHDAEQLLLEEGLSARIPNDFPANSSATSLAGAQPKLAVRKIAGRFVAGLTARERYARWDVCEDLAQQLVAKALKDAERFPENSREMTLRRVRQAIEGKAWTSELETDWLIERLRLLLAW